MPILARGYNTSMAQECLDAVRAELAVNPNWCILGPEPGFCAYVGQLGTVKAGVTCEGVDCAPGPPGTEVYCQDLGVTGGATCLIAKPNATAGEPCVGTRGSALQPIASGGDGFVTFITFPPDAGTPPSTGNLCTQSAGLACSQASRTCVPVRANGQACEYDSDCAVGSYCDEGAGQTCATRIEVGGSCNVSGCVDSAGCDPTTNKCVTFVPPGAPCPDPFACYGVEGMMYCKGGVCDLPASANQLATWCGG
jgi:hypothetical protein